MEEAKDSQVSGQSTSRIVALSHSQMPRVRPVDACFTLHPSLCLGYSVHAGTLCTRDFEIASAQISATEQPRNSGEVGSHPLREERTRSVSLDAQIFLPSPRLETTDEV